MEKLIFYIHSFSDIITNSSSEIFINSNKKTIDAVKTLINWFLEHGGSTKKADDLFIFKVVRDDPEMHVTNKSESCLEIINKFNGDDYINLTNEIRNAFQVTEESN